MPFIRINVVVFSEPRFQEDNTEAGGRRRRRRRSSVAPVTAATASSIVVADRITAYYFSKILIRSPSYSRSITNALSKRRNIIVDQSEE